MSQDVRGLLLLNATNTVSVSETGFQEQVKILNIQGEWGGSLLATGLKKSNSTWNFTELAPQLDRN